ncbi:MAG: PTS sugar transporter subunit IIA [Bdellovibrionales bacterium]
MSQLAADVFADAQITLDLPATSKKEALLSLCQLAALETNVHERKLYEAIAEREALAATGLGQGLAIPHAKVEGVDRVFGVLARLAQPVEYDAIDGKPVDVIFMLIAPADAGSDHLRALAAASRFLRDPVISRLCRMAKTTGGLQRALTPGEIDKYARAAE